MSNPLDLNNLPMDFSRDHDNQPLDDLSFTPASAAAGGGGGYKKKQNGVVVKQDGSSTSGKKVYKCRFCSLTFLKSQSLGGHMNRHREEREKETLDMARQLVFGKDKFYQPSNQPMVHGGYKHYQASGHNMGSASYPTTLFSGGGSTIALPPVVAPHPHLPSLGIPYSYAMGHGYSAGSPFIHMNRITTTTSPPNGESGDGSSRHANANLHH